ncbi:MAG: arylesterase [Leptospiraceae bacterium]|nr:arylesterase [Leptospiraceae bacterium]
MALFRFLIFIFFLNCFGNVKNIGNEDCSQIGGPPGPEDFVIDRENGIMYITSHERRKEGEFGSIYWIDLKQEEKKAYKFNMQYPSSFRPHGLSLANTKDGKKLYVISHLDDYFGEAHAIEVFKIEKSKLVHEKSMTNEFIVSPNDLYVTDDERIFISNDHGNGGKISQLFQDAFALDSSAVAYYDGNKWQELDEKIAFGNGIHHIEQDGKEFVYRASSLDKKVSKYKFSIKEGKPHLEFIKDFELNSMMDNFELDDNGNLIVVGHYSVIKFLRNKSSKDNLSPVQVFRIDKNDNVKEIFSNSGELISSASVSGIYKGRIYLGQVFEPFILNCKAPE